VGDAENQRRTDADDGQNRRLRHGQPMVGSQRRQDRRDADTHLAGTQGADNPPKGRKYRKKGHGKNLLMAMRVFSQNESRSISRL